VDDPIRIRPHRRAGHSSRPSVACLRRACGLSYDAPPGELLAA
jgi:hypothetical protein